MLALTIPISDGGAPTVCRREDLPEDRGEIDPILLGAMGSPDPRQIDGLGAYADNARTGDQSFPAKPRLRRLRSEGKRRFGRWKLRMAATGLDI